jgi:hypothetical protein
MSNCIINEHGGGGREVVRFKKFGHNNAINKGATLDFLTTPSTP